jgi:hypothetical protein
MEALAPGRVERRDDGFWRISYVPAALREVPEPLRRRCDLPSESYAAITFDKSDLDAYRSLTFVGPGHPLFKAVVHHVLARFGSDLKRGAVLHDPAGEFEGLLWLLVGGVADGLGRVAGKELFALFQPLGGDEWKQISPARLLDFEPISTAFAGPQSSDGSGGLWSALSDDEGAHRQRLAEVDAVVDWSLDHVLDPYLAELQERRREETDIIRDYLRRFFNVLIARSQGKLMEYEQKMSWQDRIVIDPEILVGKPVVKGTRIRMTPLPGA